MRKGLLVSFLTVALISCGGGGPVPGPSASPPLGLATGIQALDIAREAAPTATGISRMTISFARAGGTAEYWTVFLFDPTSPSQYQKVEIQGRETVAVAAVDQPPDGGVPVGFEVMRIDSSRAEDAVRQLDWAQGQDVQVALSPIALDIGGSDSPAQVRGRATWRFIVSRTSNEGPQLIGLVWVGAENGDIAHTQRS